MARVPGIDQALGLVQAQTTALASVPGTLLGVAREVSEVVVQARETLAAVHRAATRLDALVQELDQPLRDLVPGIRRLATVLDDPVVDDLPATVRQVRTDLLPLLRTVAEAQERVAGLAGPLGLFRRPQPPTVPGVVVDPDDVAR